MAKGKTKSRTAENLKPAAVLEITWLDREKLVPNPENPRDNRNAVEAVAASIQKFGWRSPLVARRGTLMLEAGHTRLAAAELLGLDVVPVVLVDDSDTTARQFMIADNKTAELSQWNENALAGLLRELAKEDATGGLGFEPDEVKTFLDRLERSERREDFKATAERDTSETPELDELPSDPKAAVSKTGDVWEVAGQTLVCGDSKSEELVRDLFGKDPVPLIITDPPYCSGSYQEAGKTAGTWGDIASDNLSTRGFLALLRGVLAAARAQVVYMFTDWRQWSNVTENVLESSGLAVRSMIVWNKKTPALGYIWRTQHEIVAFASRKNPARTKGTVALGNVITCPRTRNVHHYTEKPVEVLAQLMEGDVAAGRGPDVPIFDPFAGSATTLLAAVKQKRRAFGVEIEPRIVDAAVRRLQKATGEAAVLRGTKKTFAEVEAERTSGED